MLFRDRTDAGKRLATAIESLSKKDLVVLALPRGGLPLGVLIAQQRDAPFGMILAKKIGHPTNSEYAIGAVAEGGAPILGEGYVERLHASWVKEEVPRIQKEMAHKRTLYGEYLKNECLKGQDILIVDDGIATGLTMFAAIQAVSEQEPNSIQVAVPVVPEATYEQLKQKVEDIYVLEAPAHFLGGIGAYYENFPQLTDEQVKDWLKRK